MQLSQYIFHSMLALTLLAAAETYAKVDTGGTKVTISAMVVAPPPCTVPANMNISFENVNVENITTYKKKIDYFIMCEGSSKIKMKITGEGATFDGNVLKTSNGNLGIRLYADGTPWHINTPLPINYPVIPQIDAMLVKQRNATLATGIFTSEAIMIVETN